jgi:hypothetical protein
MLERLLQQVRLVAHNDDLNVDVIVVDSSEGTYADRAEELSARWRAKYLRGPKPAGPKRNIGAWAAQTPLVLFLDSDCWPEPGIFRAHVDRYAEPDVAAVAGPTEMHGELTWPWRIMATSREYNQCYAWPVRFSILEWATTSNLSVRREQFIARGGFDEMTYTPVGGEDVDFGVRLTAVGLRLVGEPSARVAHARSHIRTLGPILRSLFTYGRADVWLQHKHPDRVVWFYNHPAAVCLALLLSVATLNSQLILVALACGNAVPIYRALRRELGPDPYGARATAGGGRGRLAARIAACYVDLAFPVGTMVEAIRRGTPLASFKRFNYLDPTRFIQRGGRSILAEGIQGDHQ